LADDTKATTRESLSTDASIRTRCVPEGLA
jgi:hypothetical protein